MTQPLGTSLPVWDRGARDSARGKGMARRLLVFLSYSSSGSFAEKRQAMLRSAKELQNYSLKAIDGRLGRSRDLLFSDDGWVVRYLVADTRKWLLGKRVLLSPLSIDRPDWRTQAVSVRLTKQQIREAPDIAEDAPVSRQHEIELARFYAVPHYWSGPDLWGASSSPYPPPVPTKPEQASAAAGNGHGDPHLRSVREVTGYRIKASDGEIGHLDDVIVDDKTWVIRYLVVDIGRRQNGQLVLLAPTWVTHVDWGTRTVTVGIPKQAILEGPRYDPHEPINRQYETRLYDFHGRPVYWF